MKLTVTYDTLVPHSSEFGHFSVDAWGVHIPEEHKYDYEIYDGSEPNIYVYTSKELAEAFAEGYKQAMERQSSTEVMKVSQNN